jgi:hypothetical protein
MKARDLFVSSFFLVMEFIGLWKSFSLLLSVFLFFTGK